MASVTANEDCAGPVQRFPPQHHHPSDSAMADIAALAELGMTLPSQLHHVNDGAMTDVAALAEIGQTLPPQRYKPNGPAMTNVAAPTEMNAGCVGRVCSQGHIFQAPSSRATTNSGQSRSTLLLI